MGLASCTTNAHDNSRVDEFVYMRFTDWPARRTSSTVLQRSSLTVEHHVVESLFRYSSMIFIRVLSTV